MIGFDTETFRIAQQAQLPKIVCGQFYDPQTSEQLIINDTNITALEAAVDAILSDEDPSHFIVCHFAAYDMGVSFKNFPKLASKIFLAYEKGKIKCTNVREKLLNLAKTGDLQFVQIGDAKKKLSYSLDALVLKYLAVDISETKKGSDAWRTNFSVLSGMPLEQWPHEAKAYAMSDAVYVIPIYEAQEKERRRLIDERGIDPFASEDHRTMLSFCLSLMSEYGVATDALAVDVIEKELAEKLSPQNMALLYEKGFLRPAKPPRPYANGAKNHIPTCTAKTSAQKAACACPPKLAAAEEETKDTGKIEEYIIALYHKINAPYKCQTCGGSRVLFDGKDCPTCADSGHRGYIGELPMLLKRTEKGDLSFDADWREQYSHLDPALEQLDRREKLQKLVTTELPRLKVNGAVAPVVHPQYDVLKETGRTSSMSSKSTEYASVNIQNIDPRVRSCFVARPGSLLFSCDIHQMELGTLAQTCYNLFGHSTLMEKINAGVDVHAFTGSALAYAKDPQFAAYVNEQRMDAFKVFNSFKTDKDKGARDYYDHWRKFAKPVNLGYPGGLGAATMVAFARKTYDVTMTEAEAKEFKVLWLDTYPEMREYFTHINKNLVDKWNTKIEIDDTGERHERELYAYTTPFGMHRAGCDYCACANGLGLQSPSAEGATTAVINIVRACYDPSFGSILYGRVYPWGFVHDEVLGDVRDDGRAHECMEEIRRIMILSMKQVTPNVVANATPVLMKRWDKNAKPVYVGGRLSVWTPEKTK